MNKAIANYLQEIIGVTLSPATPMLQSERLPYFMTDAFDLVAATIEGFPVRLATPRVNLQQRLEQTVQQLRQLGARLNEPVVFCPPTLTSYERRNLIRYKMPFIVPGKQMYLPHLGIDLRERVLQSPIAVDTLAPSSQALLIWSLLNLPAQNEWEPAPAAAALGYTPMAATRAARELEAAGLAKQHKRGRIKYLEKTGDPHEMWARAKPFLKSPILRTVSIANDALRLLDQNHLRQAGTTALAAQTTLEDTGTESCFAIPQRQWHARPAQVEPLQGFEQGAIRLQVWSYETAICNATPWVDPLSLTLTLTKDPDDRIQIALHTLMEQVAW